MISTSQIEELDKKITELEALLDLERNKKMRFTTLFHHLPYEVHIWEVIRNSLGNIESWKLVDANSLALKTWGKSIDDVRGFTAEDIFPDANPIETFLPIVEKIFSENEPYHWEVDFSGTKQLLSMVSIPLGDMFISAGADISSLKSAEDELKDTFLRLQESIRAANIGLWDWDLRTDKVTFSEEYKAQVGYTDEEFSNEFSQWESRVHPDDLDTYLRSIKCSIQKKSIHHEGEFRFRHKDGHYLWIFAHASVICDENGDAMKMIGSHIDISHIKELELQARQNQKMETVGKLTSGIAHDFNNQLSSISGFAELLEDNVQDPKLKGYVHKILASVESSSHLIKKLLTFSRKQELDYRVIDVCECVTEVEELLRSTIDKRITIHTDFETGSVGVLGDPSQFQNALLNICLNARDAIEGKGDIWISISLDNNQDRDPDNKFEDWVVISIRDSGVGMSEKTMKKVFEPFFTTKGEGEGTGLGLASVHATCEQMKGHIEIKSELGIGSSFILYLPIAELAKERKTQEATLGSHGTNQFHSKTVLMVDDEPMIKEIFESVMSKLGYTGIFAHDGEEALEIFRDGCHDIDLVILDMIMPKMNGKDTFTEMKKIDKHVKAIISSGYMEGDSHADLLEIGLTDTIEKPYKLKDLVACITSSLS